MESASPYVRIGGMDVERDALRVAEAVQAYDPNLRVQYLEQVEDVGDAPFRLVERGRDGHDRIVFTFWQLDDRVLDRIRAADTVRNDVEATIDAANAKAKAAENYRYQEKMNEAAEISRAILASPKDTYTVGDKTFRA